MMDYYEEKRGEYGYPEQAKPMNPSGFNAFSGVAKIKYIRLGILYDTNNFFHLFICHI